MLTSRRADWYRPVVCDSVVRDFQFHDGAVASALKLRYTVLGNPDGEPLLVLHGTGGTGSGLLNPKFGGALFGKGKPLDAARHFVVLPDAIGHGGSAKPSDGLRARFYRYNYDDMVEGQYRIVKALGLSHLKLVLGASMGGMHAWLWGIRHPEFMDALVPLASTPAPMSGRNWLMRRLLVDAVRADPQWNDGNYVEQPAGVRAAWELFKVATDGGTVALHRNAPDRAKADLWLACKRKASFTTDANDLVYQLEASRDYDPSADLHRIVAPVLAINSADDERNPVEIGLASKAVQSIRNGRFVLIPASGTTHGHSTVEHASLWAETCRQFLQSIPSRYGVQRMGSTLRIGSIGF